MSLRRLALLLMVALLAAPSAYAQDDDDFLTPLTDSEPAPAKKGKKRTTTPKKPKKPKKGAGSVASPTAEPEEDELGLTPLVESKTELVVKLSGGSARGARLLVDNKDMGALPGRAREIAPGEHTIVVRKPGYTDFTQRITAEAGKRTEVVATLEAAPGLVAVKVDAPGASVTIDGEDKGLAPLTDVPLKPGSHVIEARRDGFEPARKTLTVRTGKEYTVNLRLRPSAGAVASKPPPVEEAAKPPPVEVAAKPPPAEVAAKPPPVEVAAKPPPQPRSEPVLTPKPQPPPEQDEAAVALAPDAETRDAVAAGTPLLKRWYFWAGVGAVAAGAVVGAVAMSQTSPATPLTLRDVCGDSPCDGHINAPTGSGIVRF